MSGKWEEQYRELKRISRDLMERCVMMAVVVEDDIRQGKKDPQQIAARVECMAVELALNAMKLRGGE